MKMGIDGQLIGFVKLKARPEEINTLIVFRSITDIISVTSNIYLITDWGNDKCYLLELAKNNTNATIKEVINVLGPRSIALSASKR